MSDTERSGRSRGKRSRGIYEYPKGSGAWWVCYFDEHGRRHREKVGPKALAAKVYQKLKTEIAERRFFPDRLRRRHYLLADVIDDFLSRNRDRLRAFGHYCRHGRTWKAAFPGRTLAQVLPGDVERYVADRRQQAAPGTVNRELSFLRRVYNVAIADQKADTNPVRSKMFFRENNARVRFLTDDEQTRLATILDPAHWALVLVAIHTGLRRSEQFSLRWEHVDFTNGILTVPRSKHGETRRVAMNDTVRDILRTLPSRLKSAYVFPNTAGDKPHDASNFVRRIFVPALGKAGIEGFQ